MGGAMGRRRLPGTGGLQYIVPNLLGILHGSRMDPTVQRSNWPGAPALHDSATVNFLHWI
jgi:hypothetical protein